jgi:YebC/PmpR family DNA-binding regulatory protein
MSGHSKWAQIKRQKGTADQKRGNLFTKLANAITIATREKGSNPETNFKLRLSVDQAKAANMPRENIERAIKRGSGELSGNQIEKIVYEAIGPGGVGLVIESLTDNKNRAVSSLRHILGKYDGTLTGPNSILWKFEQKGVLRLENFSKKIKNLEEFELKLIDLGAEEITQEESDLVIYTSLNNLQKLKEILSEENITPDYAEVEYVTRQKSEITDKALAEKLNALFEDLDNDPDINNYYSNATV